MCLWLEEKHSGVREKYDDASHGLHLVTGIAHACGDR